MNAHLGNLAIEFCRHDRSDIAGWVMFSMSFQAVWALVSFPFINPDETCYTASLCNPTINL